MKPRNVGYADFCDIRRNCAKDRFEDVRVKNGRYQERDGNRPRLIQ